MSLFEEQRAFAAGEQANAETKAKTGEELATNMEVTFLSWKKQVGKNIAGALARRGIAMTDVSRLSQGRVMYQTVRHCVIGENFPGSRLLWQLREEFGITLSEVFEGM